MTKCISSKFLHSTTLFYLFIRYLTANVTKEYFYCAEWKKKLLFLWYTYYWLNFCNNAFEFFSCLPFFFAFTIASYVSPYNSDKDGYFITSKFIILHHFENVSKKLYLYSFIILIWMRKEIPIYEKIVLFFYIFPAINIY